MKKNISNMMRDVFIKEICNEMSENKKIIFLSDDFGAPALDKLREKFKDRFINVGIAEQNLINIACGLALEGFIVYVYGISAFVTMRSYEQIRVDLSQLSQVRDINVNIIGVGAGMSYDISGPSHHCYEDISLIRLLPNFILFSPSDCLLTRKFVSYSINIKKPKYIRLDSKPLVDIYKKVDMNILEKGFCELKVGERICIISTGYMTHVALKVAYIFSKNKINLGVMDIFVLKPACEKKIKTVLEKYEIIVTLEEGFINKGGLDAMVYEILSNNLKTKNIINIGIKDKYNFDVGGREYLHKINKIDEEHIIKIINEKLKI